MTMTYWDKRHKAEAEALLNESIYHSHKRVQKIYLDTANYCIGQLETIYVKIQNANGSDNVTRQMVYQYQGYFDRLKACMSKLDSLSKGLTSTLSKNLIDLYEDNARYINKSTLKPLGIKIGFDNLDKRAETASQAIWATDGKSWSNRVWGDTAKLKATLQDIIPNAMASGQGVMKMTAELQKEFSVSFSKAKTLATTELTHIYAVSAQETFKDAGFEEWEWSTSEDAGVCEECDRLNGTRYSINNTQALPPAHPNCRCIAQPVIEINRLINLEYEPKF